MRELWPVRGVGNGFLCPPPPTKTLRLLTHPPSLPPQGSGRYSIYIANYAYGNVGPDALIEMDPEASDLSRGILALRDVAAEAGVSKYTGRHSDMGGRRGAGGAGAGPCKAEPNSSGTTVGGGAVPEEGG